MSLKLNSSGGGSVTLQEPSTASNVTLDLPATAGTMLNSASTLNADNMTTGTLPVARIASASIDYTKLSNDNVSIKFRGGFPSAPNQNFDTLQASGFYDIATGNFTGISNAPPSYSYGNLLVMFTVNFIVQVYYPNAANVACWRSLYTAGTTWTAWRTFG